MYKDSIYNWIEFSFQNNKLNIFLSYVQVMSEIRKKYIYF